ncbi:MAG: GntP family permease [Candidatus Methylacidiphilales bacterium]
MSVVIVFAALIFLMIIAYRGYSVILFAPIAALGAVLLTDASLVAPMFSGLFMVRLADFLKQYFPVFLLGAIFGKLMEISGFAKSIVATIIATVGSNRAIASIVAVCALLTYGGVSLFVVVFAVYPFAAEMFKRANIPKRLIPGSIALGAFTFTMDCLPGTPQIQNIIPTTFFKTTIFSAPWLGIMGAVFILIAGLAYMEWRRRTAELAGEGYGENLINEPETVEDGQMCHPAIAIIPLLLVGVMNYVFTSAIPWFYGPTHSFQPSMFGKAAPVTQEISRLTAVWAVEGALLIGIASVLAFSWKSTSARFAEGTKPAISGALLASMNTASEYGFGAVIAALPGFVAVTGMIALFKEPLIDIAITVSALAGITGSASGGLSIALAAMQDTFIPHALQAGIPAEVLHRVASMASGGMDTLPHNGAVITLLSVTGLTHAQSYRDIFAITLIKTAAVFVVIAVFYLTGLV